MIRLESITEFFYQHGHLRKSQLTTLAALVWALLPNPLLGVAKIGRRLAVATRRPAKSAIKRVDRFLGNRHLDVTVAQADLIQTLLADATEALLTLDWTDPHDGVHQILTLNVRAHGRALPLAWRTVRKAELAGQMRATEIALCQQAAAAIPAGCHVMLLADRGFAAPELFAALTTLGWDWIIRAPGRVQIVVQGRRQGLWRWADQRPVLRDLPHIRYGSRRAGTVLSCRAVIAADRQHREPWFLIVSAGLTPAVWPAARIVAAYGQRWTTEECFKDEKNDGNEGFHLDCVRLTTPARWDRLLLIFAWTYYWQSVAGTLLEATGQDRLWRANTVRTHRTHALWRLGVWALASGAITWRQLRQAQRRWWATIPPIVGSPHWPDTA